MTEQHNYVAEMESELLRQAVAREKHIKKISKYLQIGLLLTFFLPFFPSGCKDSSTPQTDSAAIETPVPEFIDTSQIDTSKNINFGTETIKDSRKDTIDPPKSDKEETLSDKIIIKVPFLRFILKPGDKYSGIGYIIDVFWSLVTCFGIVITLALWIIGLRLKIKDHKSFQVLNIVGLILLYTTDPVMLAWLNDSKLWGYWVCFWWAVIMIMFDFNRFLKRKKVHP